MNPFDQLVNPHRTRLPKTTSASVVVGGKRIEDVRQLKVEADHDDLDVLDARVLRKQVQAAKAAAAYQRARLDPVKMAKRQAWQQANQDKVRAYKKVWDKKNKKKLREQQNNWMTRAYRADPEKYKQRGRDYYAKNREAILARLAAKAAGKKDTQRGGQHG